MTMHNNKLLIFFSLVLLSLTTLAQTVVQDTTKKASTQVYTYVEQMPVFPGGQQALMAAIAQNVRYPLEALHTGTQGIVFVRFVVGIDANIQDVNVWRGVNPLLDAAAVQAVQQLPSFSSPGRQAGRPVAVSYTVPVRFAIQDKSSTSNETSFTREITPAHSTAYFPDGPEALRSYLANVPLPAGVSAITGNATPPRVFVAVSIDNTGKVLEAKAIQPPSEEERRINHQPKPKSLPNPLLLAAAEAHIRAMPTWKLVGGTATPTTTQFTLPVTFGPGSSALAYVSVAPKFSIPGGAMRYIASSIRYPYKALSRNTTGTVSVYFEIAENGQVENAEVICGVSPELDREVLRVFKTKFPPYTPGFEHDKPVRVFQVLPFTFEAE